jgi:flagellar protein FlgJ
MNPIMDANNLQTNALQWQGQAQASKMNALQKQIGAHDEKKLKQAAQDFEAIFVHQMLDAMDKTVDREGSILSGGSSEQYFRGMLNEEIAKSMTNRLGGSGFGLAESIYRQMAGQLKPQSGTEAGAANPTSNTIQGSGKTGEVQP